MYKMDYSFKINIMEEIFQIGKHFGKSYQNQHN